MLPILISIPHASTFVPPDIRHKLLLNDHEIASYSDLYTEEIYDIPNTYKVEYGVSRLVCDPNRAPDDLISEAHLAIDGSVIQIAEDLKPIYKKEKDITMEMVQERIETYHDKYHDKIDNHLKDIKFLIDGHSLKSVGPATKPDAGQLRADIVLGNRDYTTCSREQTHFFKTEFEKRGLSVKINDPYSGKYVLGYHCSRKNLPGIQIEINRRIYMDEETLEKNQEQVDMLNKMLTEIVNSFYQEFLS